MKHHLRPRRHSAVVQAVQMLEPRQLLSYTLSSNSAVVMNTSLGEVTVQLLADTPITSANFLSYVTAGSYNNTVFHRIAVNNQTQFQGTTETYSIVQGGGFTNDNGTFNPITVNNPITNEYSSANPDAPGTIAMARTSSLDSATSQFFFNVSDNSSIFPNYAVFGNVIRGMGIVDAIDNLTPDANVSGQTNVPETSTGAFVTINSATEEDTLTVSIGKNDSAGDHAVSFRDPTAKAGSTISLSGADATITFTGTNITEHRSNGVLSVTGTGLQLQEISSSDTTAKSSLVFSSPGLNKHIDIGDINIDGSLNSIVGSGVNLTGDINVTGGINSIKLLATNAAGFISLDTDGVVNAPATTINIPFLSDISIQSGAPIKELIARQYSVDDGTSRAVEANGAITKVLVYGAMEAGVEGQSIGNFKAGEMTSFIAGQTVGNVTVVVYQQGYIYSSAVYNAKTLGISKVNVKGSLSGVQIVAAGNIGSVKAGAISGTVIAAGIDSTGNVSPVDGFQNALTANATIKSISLKTPKGAKNTSFSDSQIAAGELDSLHLGRVATTLPSSPSITVLGIQTNYLKSLVTTTDQGQSLDLSNIKTQAAVNSAIAKRKIKLNNFTFSVGSAVQSS